MKLLFTIALLISSGMAAQTNEGLRGVESLGAGVYCRAADGTWAKIEPISSGGFESRARFMSAKAVTVYSGAAAAVQIADRRPTFYLKEPIPAMGMSVVTQGVSSSTTVATQGGQAQTPPSTTSTRGETSSTYSIATQSQDARSLILVRLAKKKNSRELTYAGGTAFNFHSGVGSEDLVETVLSPIEGGGYTLRPKADLKPGEYIIVTRGIMGVVGYGYGYDFGVSK
jgi:hypothetical protein